MRLVYTLAALALAAPLAAEPAAVSSTPQQRVPGAANGQASAEHARIDAERTRRIARHQARAKAGEPKRQTVKMQHPAG